jgi:hypothetical protein
MGSQQKIMGSQQKITGSPLDRQSSILKAVGNALAAGDPAATAFEKAKKHRENAIRLRRSAHVAYAEAHATERVALEESAVAQRLFQEALKMVGDAVRLDEHILEQLSQQDIALRQEVIHFRELAASAQRTARALGVLATEIRITASQQNDPALQTPMIAEANRLQQQATHSTQEALKFTHLAAINFRAANELGPQMNAVRRRIQSLRAEAKAQCPAKAEAPVPRATAPSLRLGW